MLDRLASMVKWLLEPRNPEAATLKKRISCAECDWIREVIDSCDMEGRIAVTIEWVHRLYRRGALSTETYHELIHHAVYKEKTLITDKVHREHVMPYIRKRAEEIIKEERAKKVRIVKPSP